MFSGARTSAPRWSVVGLIGWIEAGSRASSSRPPPDATAETTATSASPTRAVGSSRRTSWARPGPPAPGRYAGTTAIAAVASAKTSRPTRKARGRRTWAARKRSSVPTSATALA